MVFPEGFLDHLQHCEGFNREEFILAHDTPAPVSIRINNRKPARQTSELQQIPWCTSGYYLKTRPAFTLDPLFHAGAYYVQEASGMFVEYILQQILTEKQPLTLLDLCAAPGGKSTIMASFLGADDLLVSNEVIRSRVHVLQENMIKSGSMNVIVTNNDPAAFSSMQQLFDVILVDAPCSGSGLFRKDPSAMREWSIENVLHCQKRQQRILKDVFPALKENGILIYTTCSYSKEENEDIADFLTINFPCEYIAIPEIKNAGIFKSKNGYRFYPNRLQGEGFFASVFRKKKHDDLPEEFFNSTHSNFSAASDHDKDIAAQFMHADAFEFFNFHETLHAINKSLIKKLYLFTTLNWKAVGTAVGKIIGDHLIPAHSIALGHLLKHEIPHFELDLKNAISYLRKESLDVQIANEMFHKKSNSDLISSNGWLIITNQSIPIGWVKVLNNRINNYYPTEWRIRK